VPLRATDDAILVNWFSIEILNAKGKRTYYNSFVTDLAIAAGTVAELAACGRARWKIENETFNVLKTKGYNLEHNFGHGKKTLASVLVTSTCSPSRSTPPLISASSPGAPLSSPVVRHIASSSACGPSPLTSSSATGPTCYSPSPQRRYDHLDHALPPSRQKPTQTRRQNFENTRET
jgi:hypothetical protein